MKAPFSVHSQSLGVARSLLALSTAMTLAVHRADHLFAPLGKRIQESLVFDWPYSISLFALVGDRYLPVAKWLAVAALLVVATGWRPRWTGWFHWWISFSFFASALPIEGGDQVTSVLTLLMLPICATDPRRWHWQPSEHRSMWAFSAWIVIRLQVAWIYLHAAVGKMPVADWANGTALYYWFSHPVFGAPPWFEGLVELLTHNRWTVVLLTWGVIGLELALFAALFAKRTWWRFFLVPAVLFHLGIALIHGLVTFAIAMAAALILFLWDPVQSMGVERLWRRVGGLLHRRGEPAAPPPAAQPEGG